MGGDVLRKVAGEHPGRPVAVLNDRPAVDGEVSGTHRQAQQADAHKFEHSGSIRGWL